MEFAAFTATADGDLKWTITATAELNTLSRSPDRGDTPSGAEHSHHNRRRRVLRPHPRPSGSPTVTHSDPSPA